MAQGSSDGQSCSHKEVSACVKEEKAPRLEGERREKKRRENPRRREKSASTRGRGERSRRREKSGFDSRGERRREKEKEKEENMQHVHVHLISNLARALRWPPLRLAADTCVPDIPAWHPGLRSRPGSLQTLHEAGLLPCGCGWAAGEGHRCGRSPRSAIWAAKLGRGPAPGPQLHGEGGRPAGQAAAPRRSSGAAGTQPPSGLAGCFFVGRGKKREQDCINSTQGLR